MSNIHGLSETIRLFLEFSGISAGGLRLDALIFRRLACQYFFIWNYELYMYHCIFKAVVGKETSILTDIQHIFIFLEN